MVLSLPAMQALANDRKALAELHIVVEDQAEALDLFEERLELCEERLELCELHSADDEIEASDESQVIEDILVELDAAKAAEVEARADLKGARFLWFTLGAAAAALVVGGSVAVGAML